MIYIHARKGLFFRGLLFNRGCFAMHLNLVEKIEDLKTEPSDSARVRELTALASIVDFAIYTAESTGSYEALAYLRNVADFVKADLARA